MYRDLFGNYNDAASYKILSQWKLDYKNQREMRVVGSGASYGKEIDEKLHGMVSKRMRLGLPIDNFILRTLLVKLLILHDKEGMLKEYGGIHTCDSAWADRFYKNKRRLKMRLKMRLKLNDWSLDFVFHLEQQLLKFNVYKIVI